MEIAGKKEVTTHHDAPQIVSAGAVLACAWPALLLSTVCLLPFLNKAFLTDDPWFLKMAQQIVKHPMRPMDFDLCWNNRLAADCRNAYQIAAGNGLKAQIGQGYVLVPTMLGGAHEWIAHVTQLVLAWIAIAAMTALIFRFGWDRWHATAGALLLVAIPPFLPMASTALPDTLATALALVGMEQLAAWKAEQKWSRAAAAAVALGVAGFARPHLVLLLPLGAFFLIESLDPTEMMAQVRRRAWLWVPVFAGGGLLLAILAALREHDVTTHPPPFLVGRENIRSNLYAYLLYFAFPLPLAACWLANRFNARKLRFIFVVSAIAAFPGLFRWNLALVLFFAVFGLGVLADLLLEATRKSDHTGLLLMLWILIPLPVVYYAHLPIKYLLPCTPAVIFLCFRLLEDISDHFARYAAIVLIVAGTGYSLLILRSDAEYANFGRETMYALITPHVAAGERVWFPGECCSYWYADLDGAKLAYPGGPQPVRGDLVVVDGSARGDFPQLQRFPARTLIETRSHKYRFGRTVGLRLGGLYGGFWMWGLDAENEKDRFELWRID